MTSTTDRRRVYITKAARAAAPEYVLPRPDGTYWIADDSVGHALRLLRENGYDTTGLLRDRSRWALLDDTVREVEYHGRMVRQGSRPHLPVRDQQDGRVYWMKKRAYQGVWDRTPAPSHGRPII